MNAIPVPSVTRRDSVLNIAAHAALNSNPPDLGPKGYFSDISYDNANGSGSTKLHSESTLADLTFVGVVADMRCRVESWTSGKSN